MSKKKKAKGLRYVKAQAGELAKSQCRINGRGELLLYGIIGDYWDDLDAATIVRQLEAMSGDEIVVRIHSDGGSVLDGLAMYNALKQSEKRVIVYIDAIAASMASAVAMAGDVIYMPDNALMMIHKPWLHCFGGNADDFREIADQLDLIQQSYAMTYASKTGKPVEEINAILDEGKDIWMNGQQAVADGFADELIENVQIAATLKPQDFHNPPAAMLAKLTKAAAAANSLENSMKLKLIAASAASARLAAVLTLSLASAVKEKEDVVTLATALAMDEKELKGVLSGDTEATDEVLTAMAKAFNVAVDDEGEEPEPAAAGNGGASDVQAAADAAVTKERKRSADILALGKKLHLKEDDVQAMVDDGLSLAQARDRALDLVSAQSQQSMPASSAIGIHSAQQGNYHVDAVCALVHRILPDQPLTDSAKPLAHSTLLDIASNVLAMNGVRTQGMSKREIAFKAMSTSDFPAIVSDVANKVLVIETSVRDLSYRMLCRKGSAEDFKAKHNIKIDFGDGLEEVNENGEYKEGKIVEGKENYRVKTFGKIFTFTRQLIINDDLGALMVAIRDLVNLAYDVEEETVWGLITSNPKMADNKAVFHADHGNLIDPGQALGVEGLSKNRAAHRKMLRTGGKKQFNVAPSYILVGTDYETEAEKLIAQNLPTSTDQVNPFAGKLTPISSVYLDAEDDWYTVADPSRVPGIEFAHLQGEENPYIETRSGFEVDGIQIKIRHDFGAGWIGHQGFVKNEGAVTE